MNAVSGRFMEFSLEQHEQFYLYRHRYACRCANRSEPRWVFSAVIRPWYYADIAVNRLPEQPGMEFSRAVCEQPAQRVYGCKRLVGTGRCGVTTRRRRTRTSGAQTSRGTPTRADLRDGEQDCTVGAPRLTTPAAGTSRFLFCFRDRWPLRSCCQVERVSAWTDITVVLDLFSARHNSSHAAQSLKPRTMNAWGATQGAQHGAGTRNAVTNRRS